MGTPTMKEVAKSAITYAAVSKIGYEEFIGVLQSSGLAERRPVEDPERIHKMLVHANLFITARHGGRLIGIARSLTDFSFICYLSDLAVDRTFQRQGIGTALMVLTKKHAGCQSILLSAPAARSYYTRQGLRLIDNAFDFSFLDVSAIQSDNETSLGATKLDILAR